MFSEFITAAAASFVVFHSIDRSPSSPPESRSPLLLTKLFTRLLVLTHSLPLLACSLVCHGALEMAVAVNTRTHCCGRQRELRQCVRASVFGYAVRQSSSLEGSLLSQVQFCLRGGREGGRGMVENVCALLHCIDCNRVVPHAHGTVDNILCFTQPQSA